MIFLGIDPGLSEVGFGITEVKQGEPHFIDCGIIKTSPSHSFGERLSIIKKDMEEILDMHRYTAVGIEELFFVKNITNGIKVAHARGVLLQAIHEKGFPILEFKPSEIKSAICGSGSADKLQVQTMVKRLLNLNELPKPHDAADALAISLLAARMYKS